MDELEDSERFAAVNSFRDRDRLIVGTYSSEEIRAIFSESSLPGCRLSPTDISVAIYAQKNNYCVLTGDCRLKEYIQKQGNEAHGILFLFEAMVEHGILPPSLAASYLVQLQSINKWLPIDIIDKMIKKWSS